MTHRPPPRGLYDVEDEIPSRPGPSRRLRRGLQPDAAIQGTDDDALGSRLSAVELGYIKDPYARLFAKAPSASAAGSASDAGHFPVHRPPLINVGTHHRSWALDNLVERFLAANPGVGKQIVSLGAGSDTRFWRISAEHPEALHAYIELDFPDMTAHKARKIVSNPALAAAVAERDDNATISRHFVSRGGAQLDGERYHLVPLDLRDAGAADPKGPTRAESSTERTATTLSKVRALLDPTRPTLVLAECVLCYMRPEESAAVLRWFGDEFERVVGAVYEMCGLDDAFGRVMRSNLQSRNIPLPGATFASPAAQAERFLAAGFSAASALSLKEIRRRVIPPAELERISRLEMLDEVEELEMLLDHYCVAWGSKGEGLKDVSL